VIKVSKITVVSMQYTESSAPEEEQLRTSLSRSHWKLFQTWFVVGTSTTTFRTRRRQNVVWSLSLLL